jgi:uncharacterized membrane protein
MKDSIPSKLKSFFVTGLAIFIPLVATVYIVWIGFNFLDGILKPVVRPLIGDIPGVSLIITLVLIMLLGAFTRIAVGRKVMDYLEDSLLKIPVVKSIYYSIKEASELLFKQKEREYKTVVLVEYPRKGSYVIGFTTGATIEEIQSKTKQNVLNVYVPTTPNPTSGFLIMVPKEEVVPLDMTIEEAFKIIVSGGLSKK